MRLRIQAERQIAHRRLQTRSRIGRQPVEVSAKITGLAPNTAASYRVLSGFYGPISSTEIGFTTAKVAAPAVETKGAGGVGSSSVTLYASVNPRGGSVSKCTFEYGTSTSYGSSVSCASLPGSGSSRLPWMRRFLLGWRRILLITTGSVRLTRVGRAKGGMLLLGLRRVTLAWLVWDEVGWALLWDKQLSWVANDLGWGKSSYATGLGGDRSVLACRPLRA